LIAARRDFVRGIDVDDRAIEIGGKIERARDVGEHGLWRAIKLAVDRAGHGGGDGDRASDLAEQRAQEALDRLFARSDCDWPVAERDRRGLGGRGAGEQHRRQYSARNEFHSAAIA